MFLSHESPQPNEEPMMVKYVEKGSNGIETLHLSRYAIGYVMRGRLCIYDGDKRRVVGRGELFYLNIGRHYIECQPDGTQPFEQILFYYTPQNLQRVLLHLHVTYGLTITNNHCCEQCRSGSFVVAEASSSLQTFFQNMNSYLREHSFHRDETAENIKMTELVYLIVAQEDGCLKHRILNSVDKEQENFEQIIYDHIFRMVSIEDLATKTNRSLTSFKKEFRRHFNLPPHKWYVQQRLTHSRLLLISTTKSISEIGNECSFPNTSHYIKLFKRAYRMTPAAYRQHHLTQIPLSATPIEEPMAYAE